MPLSEFKPVSNRQAAGFIHRDVERRAHGVSVRQSDCIAEEVPVALIYNAMPHVVMMATPCDLHDFALGFSLSENVIARVSEMESIEIRPVLAGIEIAMTIPQNKHDVLANTARNLIGRTGCGLCGVQMLEQAIRHPPPVGTGIVIDDAALNRALTDIQTQQAINAATGAVHAAAWVSPDGRIAQLREDVGRHNALDKLIGAASKNNIDFNAGFAVITSRASYEMVLKAATVGIPFVVAISAPTGLAIHLAEETGITLVGFARATGYVIYANPHRLAYREPRV